MKKLISVAVLVFYFFAAFAQDSLSTRSLDSLKEARLDPVISDSLVRIARISRQSVESMKEKGIEPMDSIETQTPGVRILLFEDYTWKYVKDPSVILENPVFTENWIPDVPDPYNVEEKDLPDKISIWVVDTLSAYRCPNQVKVYSPFGYRHRRRHQGVDLPLAKGTPVYAAFSGKVRMSKYYAAYGNLIIIRHENGLETFYAHLSERQVEVGDWVEAGQQIGLGGSTGRSTGPHLHFETRYMGYAFDPQWLIDFENGTLRHRLFILRKKYLTAASKYVPETIEEELDIYLGDKRDHEVADSLEAVRKAEEERIAAELAAAQYHTIKSGDTLSALAVKYHTTVSAICRLNEGLTAKTTLRLGRKIRVK